MITVKVKKTNTGNETPAEVRSITDGILTVLIKDFETATLVAKQFTKNTGDLWTTADEEYSLELSQEDLGGGEILVKVPKK
jgi:hypothetical protein